MRFVCDRMLGRLARWLRMMGVDTEYPEEMDDAALAVLAADQERVLLTRDRELAGSIGPVALYIEPHGLEQQIEAFIARFGMPEGWFRRCTVCNGVLSTDEPAGVSGRVPEGILYRYRELWNCRRCGQVYWPGTQFADIEARLKGFRANSPGGS